MGLEKYEKLKERFACTHTGCTHCELQRPANCPCFLPRRCCLLHANCGQHYWLHLRLTAQRQAIGSPHQQHNVRLCAAGTVPPVPHSSVNMMMHTVLICCHSFTLLSPRSCVNVAADCGTTGKQCCPSATGVITDKPLPSAKWGGAPCNSAASKWGVYCDGAHSQQSHAELRHMRAVSLSLHSSPTCEFLFCECKCLKRIDFSFFPSCEY